MFWTELKYLYWCTITSFADNYHELDHILKESLKLNSFYFLMFLEGSIDNMPYNISWHKNVTLFSISKPSAVWLYCILVFVSRQVYYL